MMGFRKKSCDLYESVSLVSFGTLGHAQGFVTWGAGGQNLIF